MKLVYTYIIGFVLSVVFTSASFLLVVMHEASGHTTPSHEVAVPALVVFAVVQLVVQLVLFLHLGNEPKPKWNLLAFIFATLVVTIVVGGSLWIMNHLNHEQMSHYDVFEEENISPHEH